MINQVCFSDVIIRESIEGHAAEQKAMTETNNNTFLMLVIADSLPIVAFLFPHTIFEKVSTTRKLSSTAHSSERCSERKVAALYF